MDNPQDKLNELTEANRIIDASVKFFGEKMTQVMDKLEKLSDEDDDNPEKVRLVNLTKFYIRRMEFEKSNFENLQVKMENARFAIQAAINLGVKMNATPLPPSGVNSEKDKKDV